MNHRLGFLLCLFALTTFVPILRAGPEESVVKIFASTRFPNPTKPWMKGDPLQNIGTGVIIEGNRILTNAHLVEYGTEVTVQTRPGGDKVDAQVEFLNFDVDLAILTVKDRKFLEKKAPLPRSQKMPRVQDMVSLFGFPIGGSELSVTKGEVSRIDSFVYGNRGIGMVIQVSAAINPGNSGGPALVGNKMVGLVVSRAINAQNIGYVIPNDEIEIFLNGIKDGRFEGKPMIAQWFLTQKLENNALRQKFKIDDKVRGVLVVMPEKMPNDFPLKPFDVLTAIGDSPIDNAGMVGLNDGLNASYLFLVPRLARDQSLPVTVYRKGQTLKVLLPTTTKDNRLIRPYEGEPLDYFIHGPLVFAVAKTDDLPLYSQMNRTLYWDNNPMVVRRDEFVRFPGEELVVVSAPMFTHPIAKGYGNPVGKVVKEVNGIPIKNLRHLVESLRDANDRFLTFRFFDNWSEVLVFDRKEMDKATEEILEDNGIAANRRGSRNLLKIWAAKAETEK
jgi:S1-C subfamily serine protease